VITGYDFSGRTARRHCTETLQHLGFGRMKRADHAQLTVWIASELPKSPRPKRVQNDRLPHPASIEESVAQQARVDLWAYADLPDPNQVLISHTADR
jgi:hypothetical protein